MHTLRRLLAPVSPTRGFRRIERQWPGCRQYERDAGRTVRLFRLTTDAEPSPFDGRL